MQWRPASILPNQKVQLIVAGASSQSQGVPQPPLELAPHPQCIPQQLFLQTPSPEGVLQYRITWNFIIQDMEITCHYYETCFAFHLENGTRHLHPHMYQYYCGPQL